MQAQKNDRTIAERISLAEARKRIDEFTHLKPVGGQGGGGAKPARKTKKAVRRKGKR